MEVKNDYISTACGRYPSIVDSNRFDLAVFGAKNAIALLETTNDDTQIIYTEVRHKDRINVVRWIRTFGEPAWERHFVFITGSADHTAIIWAISRDDNGSIESTNFVLSGHTGAVNMVDGLIKPEGVTAVTGSMDSTIKIWKTCNNSTKDIDLNFEIGTLSCTQTICLENSLCIALKIYLLPITNDLFFACALHDNNIHLYGEKNINKLEKEFKKLRVLSGHEDWVRSLDFVNIGDSRVLLASCSQDTFIRLWSIEYFVDESTDDAIYTEKKVFNVNQDKWTVSLEAVLCGHENWVYGVDWNFKYTSEANFKNLKLLSSSLDKSLIMWAFDEENQVWIEKVRLGEVGGGGLGFYGGKFMLNGEMIVGHGYMGSFHLWKHNEKKDTWEPHVPCGGHFSDVIDLEWEPKGQFLISASLDQTTRIHSPWIRNRTYKPHLSQSPTILVSPPQLDTQHFSTSWHEIARPQVHGYDMSCLAIVDRYTFVSGAEEKVIRTFSAPNNFIENFHTICKISNNDIESLESIPEGASVPSLGLSNKAVFSDEIHNSDINQKSLDKQYTENRFIATKLIAPPTEETLMQNTLWPEQHKLYGHGYEIFALAASKDGTLIASACKATKAQYAAIILWCTKTWVQVQSLSSHNLTVTQLQFSPDSKCLLSVSRDRRWAVFQRDSESQNFSLNASTDKTNGIHTRIIWCCTWTCDSQYFATGSRDGKVVIWGKTNTKDVCWKNFRNMGKNLELKNDSITALASAPQIVNNSYVLAVGLENGIIHIYKINLPDMLEWNLNCSINNNVAHHLTVKKLAFRPKLDEDEHDNSILQFASASADNSVKIFTLVPIK